MDPTLNIPDLDPSIEVLHLRRLMDTQPACLMRLSADGVVLAVSNAALALLGMESLNEAFGMRFDAWIRPEQRERWNAFTAQVVRGAALSIEVDITTPLRGPRATLLHGAPLLDHPDRIPSLIVVARATAEQHRLEATLEERDVLVRRLQAELEEVDARQDGTRADQGQLEAALRVLEARQRELEAELGAERAAAERQEAETLADRRRLEAVLDDLRTRHGDLTEQHVRAIQELDVLAAQHAQELRAAQNSPERGQLLATLEERDAAIRQLDAARAAAESTVARMAEERQRLAGAEAAERARLQQIIDTLMETYRAEREMRESEARQRLADLQRKEDGTRQKAEALEARLDGALGELRRLQLLLQQGESAQRDLAARHAAMAAERDLLARNAAGQAVQLRALAAHERRQMALASVGRVACDIATHLHEHTQQLDGLTADVLHDCTLDNPLRPGLERLRGEAIQGAALAGELLLVGARAREGDGAISPLTEGTGKRS